MRTGDLADRGEAIPGPQITGSDMPIRLGDQLLIDRLNRSRVERVEARRVGHGSPAQPGGKSRDQGQEQEDGRRAHPGLQVIACTSLRHPVSCGQDQGKTCKAGKIQSPVAAANSDKGTQPQDFSQAQHGVQYCFHDSPPWQNNITYYNARIIRNFYQLTSHKMKKYSAAFARERHASATRLHCHLGTKGMRSDGMGRLPQIRAPLRRQDRHS